MAKDYWDELFSKLTKDIKPFNVADLPSFKCGCPECTKEREKEDKEIEDALLNDDFDDEDLYDDDDFFDDDDTPRDGINEDILAALEDAYSIVDNADFPVRAVLVTFEDGETHIDISFEG